MGRIGLVELLILMFLLAAVVGVIVLARLGAAQPAQTSPAQSGRWAPDPTRRHELRWFDGRAWSPSVSDKGVLGHDPIG